MARIHGSDQILTTAARSLAGNGHCAGSTGLISRFSSHCSLYAAKKAKNAGSMDEQKRALHALDRLTFGPRPGDIQAVTAMGVDKWIELQLHPEKIDNSAMQARLAAYRTLTMSSREMLLEFPPNPVIKAVMDGKLPMPQDPYRRAIYAAAIDRMQQKQEQKQNAAEA